MALKRTAFSAHQACGLGAIDFGGWEMPVQYAGILAEHQGSVGVGFDVAHGRGLCVGSRCNGCPQPPLVTMSPPWRWGSRNTGHPQ